jgi:hypothetical protein
MFRACFAQQLNSVIQKLLVEQEWFYAILQQAHTSIKMILEHGGQEQPWLVRLERTIRQLYGKQQEEEQQEQQNSGTSDDNHTKDGVQLPPTNLHRIVETDWTSLHSCAASLLRIRSACAQCYEDYNEDHQGHHHVESLPEELDVWTDVTFWQHLGHSEQVLRPLCEGARLLKQQGNTLAHVLLIWLTLYQKLVLEGTTDGDYWREDLECRWGSEEHHLYFLAFCLHPTFVPIAQQLLQSSKDNRGNWTDHRNPLSIARLKTAASFYYQKFQLFSRSHMTRKEQKKELQRLTVRLDMWLRGEGLEGVDEPADGWQSILDPASFWLQHSEEHGPFVNLAVFLLSCPVQVTSCEYPLRKHASSYLQQLHPPLQELEIEDPILKFSQIRQSLLSVSGSDASYSIKSTSLLVADEHPKINDTRVNKTNDSDTLHRQGKEQVVKGLLRLEDELEFLQKALDKSIHARDDEDLDVSYVAQHPPPADTDSEDESDEDDDGDGGHRGHHSGGGSNRRKHQDDPPEVVPERLEPLPDDIYPGAHDYPQEDKAYFSSIQNVRTDKYSLGTILFGTELKLPSLQNLYLQRKDDPLHRFLDLDDLTTHY